MTRPETLIEGAAHNGTAYDASSTTQRTQGGYIVSVVGDMVSMHELPNGPRVADIGCGNGRTTLEACKLLPGDAVVLASDISPSQVETAQVNLARARGEGTQLPTDISFYVAEATEIGREPETAGLDLIISNAALHWVKDGAAYKPIYDALNPGGQIAIHQGGDGCYRGLAQVALTAAEEIGIGERFEGWVYPLYYPTQSEIRWLLKQVGFRDIIVTSNESDGKEHPTLPTDYAHAGILPFINQAGSDGERLRERFLKLAGSMQTDGTLDTYTHRLLITARK